LIYILCVAGVANNTKSGVLYVFFDNGKQRRIILWAAQPFFYGKQWPIIFGGHFVFKLYVYTSMTPAVAGVFELEQVICDITQVRNRFIASSAVYPTGVFFKQS